MSLLNEDIFDISDDVVNQYFSFGKKYRIYGVHIFGRKKNITNKCINIKQIEINKLWRIDYFREIYDYTSNPLIIYLINYILNSPENEIFENTRCGTTKQLILPILVNGVKANSCLWGFGSGCDRIQISINSQREGEMIHLFFKLRK